MALGPLTLVTYTINESINKEGEGVEPRDAAGAARGLAHRRQSPRCVVCVTLCVVCAGGGGAGGVWIPRK